jgi:hypothetical protein
MALYVPSDHPQTLPGKRGGAIWTNHLNEYLAYGPPPRNYEVERAERNINVGRKTVGRDILRRYQDISTANSKRLWDHPFSPAALQATPNPRISPEFIDDREKCIGFFQPPIDYGPGQWKWNHSTSGWEGALTAALRNIGVSVTEADVKTMHENLKKDKKKYGDAKNQTLYHPGDRNSKVFKDEPACAMVAREFGYSLVIISPFVRADGTNSDAIWFMRNRPPIRARWSTGIQSTLPPVILGCLMGQRLFGAPEERVYWFAMTRGTIPAISNPFRGEIFGG